MIHLASMNGAGCKTDRKARRGREQSGQHITLRVTPAVPVLSLCRSNTAQSNGGYDSTTDLETYISS